MSDDVIHIEVDGVKLPARKGQMLIQVTDVAGVYVPRFCYHDKLSIAANCRMCLVEVEKSLKPLPACATPVMDGMKVMTRSAKALEAQKASMEFLLINHPLDCPICDQGGECELQDLAMGYGRDISRFAEKKRAVKELNLGPLISTDMTRCIHCTRCVRFGEEIAGIQELGALGRGEDMEIGTFIERSVDHELSGNIIDLCPVGALNSKPFRFRARAWEMQQVATVSAHDCFGSNLYAHVLRGRWLRTVPRVNEAVNENWISDRDRFAYEGLSSSDRASEVYQRSNDKLQPTGWAEAIAKVAQALKSAAEKKRLALWIGPSTTSEEVFLLKHIADYLQCEKRDARFWQHDFSSPIERAPWLGSGFDSWRQHRGVLLIGCDIRREVPLLAHRLRQAALSGCEVMRVSVDMEDATYQPLLFPQQTELRVAPEQWLTEISKITRDHAIGKRLQHHGKQAQILLGLQAVHHPHYGKILHWARVLSEATGCQIGQLSLGANGLGIAAMGWLDASSPINHWQAHVTNELDTLLTVGMEIESDVWQGNAVWKELQRAKTKVIALSPWVSDRLKENAHTVLPVGVYAESPGSFVNAAGMWQSFPQVLPNLGEARPIWKVLRVLAEELGMPVTQWNSFADIQAQAHSSFEQEWLKLQAQNGWLKVSGKTMDTTASAAWLDSSAKAVSPGMTAVDGVCRRSLPLQAAAGNQPVKLKAA